MRRLKWLLVLVAGLLVLWPLAVLADECGGTLYEYFNDMTAPDTSSEIWDNGTFSSMQVFQAEGTHEVGAIRLPLCADNVMMGSTVTVGLYTIIDEGDEDFVPDALLTSGTVDYHTLVDCDEWGEENWYCVTMDAPYTITQDEFYGIVVSFDGEDDGEGTYEVVCWLVDLWEWNNRYFETMDNGETWNHINSKDAMYEIYGPAEGEAATPDALFSTWKEVTTSSRPMWYQHLPSFLKLAYLGFVLASAVVVMRSKPKPEPFSNGFPDVKM